MGCAMADCWGGGAVSGVSVIGALIAGSAEATLLAGAGLLGEAASAVLVEASGAGAAIGPGAPGALTGPEPPAAGPGAPDAPPAMNGAAFAPFWSAPGVRVTGPTFLAMICFARAACCGVSGASGSLTPTALA